MSKRIIDGTLDWWTQRTTISTNVWPVGETTYAFGGNMGETQLDIKAEASSSIRLDLTLGAVRVLAIAGLAVALAGCMGYVPGRQTYWDSKVREMCQQDGGVQIYQRVRISKADVERKIVPMYSDGRLGVAPRDGAHPQAPVVSERKITYIREEPNPQVWRTEHVIRRSSDQAIVARWVIYTRAGGDIPTGISHGTSFVCPDLERIVSDLSTLFIVEGK